jgi:hypothetical protein
MSDVITSVAAAGRAPRRVRQPKAVTALPSILIDGEVWDPRKKLAAELGVCDTTLKRWNFRTAYIGGVAYIPREECLREIAGRARRRNEPALRRGRPKKEALV